VSLDIPLETGSTEHTHISFGVCPAAVELAQLKAELGAAAPTAELFLASSDKEQHYLLLVCHKSEEEAAMQALKPHSFNTVHFKEFTGTAGENIRQIDQELAAIVREREADEAAIVAHKDCREALQVAQDRYNQELSKQQVRERMLTNGTVFFLEGWVTAPEQKALEKELSTFACAYEFGDPEEGDAVPTKLNNPKWMECISMVTEMYSLPAYDGIDPNPLIFFWYIFFFGFMFADVAYGIIIFAVCQVIITLYKPKGYVFYLGRYLGISTAICGFFVGGFFGNALEVIYETFLCTEMPGWMQTFCSGIIVNPIEDPMTVLIIAIAIGCVQLVMGQCIHIYMGFRDGTGVDALLDVVPWWIVFAGIACIVLVGTPWVLVAGFLVLLLTQGRHAPTLIGKIMGGLKSWYDITSWLSDVLSYARLMALMLATSVIAMVFNTLGALVGRSVLGVIVFVVVFLVGHVFNIGVNIIGTYVHAARLQYLEYFGKFYKEGGIPFRPLQYNTKYVDVVKK
jgi:V/A-type H+-transporting ATPase subunit I